MMGRFPNLYSNARRTWPWDSSSFRADDKVDNQYTRPKITIVTPSYNQGQYLEETIRSVLLQNYPNLEYMIIDGGSTDNSVDIIKKYEPWLTYWVSEKDNGQSEAINKGFQRATGDIIAWINSDDRYVEGAFSIIETFLSSHPEVDMVYGDAEIIDTDGNFLSHRKEIAFDRTMGLWIGFGILIPQPTVFWRRNIFQSVGYLNEKLHYALDNEYWIRVSEHHQIEHIPHLLAQARYHPSSKTMLSMNGKMPLAQLEISAQQKMTYQKTPISRILPYSISPVLRNIVRLKRIFLRLFHGHYLKGYRFTGNSIKQ